MARTTKNKGPAPETQSQAAPPQEETPAQEAPVLQEAPTPASTVSGRPPEGHGTSRSNLRHSEPIPITERPFPFRATVAASGAVLRRAVIGTAEMVKPVATLDRGTAVTVVAFEGNSARLANGLYIKRTNLLT